LTLVLAAGPPARWARAWERVRGSGD